MLGSIGMPEMIIILVIALIIFGPRKLPELGRSLGKSLSEFKRASNELRTTLEEEIRLEDQKAKVETTKAAEAPAEARLDEPTIRFDEPSTHFDQPATHSDETATHSDEPVGAGASGKVDKSA